MSSPRAASSTWSSRSSKASTIDTFRQLDPVLTELAASGDDFVKAFNVFLTYPFVDEVVGRDPQVARNLHMGDYTNLSVNLDLDVADLPRTRSGKLVELAVADAVNGADVTAAMASLSGAPAVFTGSATRASSA